MAKIVRKTQKIFGSTAGVNQIGQVGSLAAGSPVFTTDPDVIQALSNYLVGWYEVVVGANSPAIQDMNALHFLYARQLAYLFQAGVGEWDTSTVYYEGSWVQVGGVLYRSLTDDNTGNNPLTEDTDWAIFGVGMLGAGHETLVSDDINIIPADDGRVFLLNSGQNVLRLPDPATFNGCKITIIDISGEQAELTSILDNPNGGDINGSSDPYVLQTDYGHWTVYCDGVNYWFASTQDIMSFRAANLIKGSFYSNWSSQATTETATWNGMAYGFGWFIGVAGSGTNRVMRSQDGVNWAAVAASEASGWSAVCSGLAGVTPRFVAVAASGTNRVMTSDNAGSSWTSRTAAEANVWTSVTKSATHFVAVSVNGTNRVMRSTDGITWATASAAEQNSWQSLNVNPDTNTLIAVASAGGSSGSNYIMRSVDDGATWTAIANFPSTTGGYSCVTYGDGRWMAAGIDGDIIYSDDDGLNWDSVPFVGASAATDQIVYGDGTFVVDNGLSRDRGATGFFNTTGAPATGQSFEVLAFGNGMFVGIANTGALLYRSLKTFTG